MSFHVRIDSEDIQERMGEIREQKKGGGGKERRERATRGDRNG